MTTKDWNIKKGDVVIIETGEPEKWWDDNHDANYAVRGKRLLVVEEREHGPSGMIHDSYSGYTEYVLRRCDRTGRLSGDEIRIAPGMRSAQNVKNVTVVGRMVSTTRWRPAKFKKE